MPTALKRGTVIVSIGASGSMPCYLYTIELLLDNGWSVVTYDYRGFGGSGGKPSLADLVPDAHTVLDWTLNRTGGTEVTLMGISLGSIPSIAVAVQRPASVNGVILDSPVALGLEIQRFGFLLGDPGLYVSFLDPLLLSENIVQGLSTPLLVLMNENDWLTPPAQTELLYELAQSPKELARFPDIGHARGVFRDTEYYSFRVESFLARVWGQYSSLPIAP
jgi:pimeloyl-ACP methyl ester carboxylesterase